MKWRELNYWQCGEWDVIKEKLHGKSICPARKDIFKALTLCPFDTVRVAIIGQDPYPDREMATGVAFSVPTKILPRNFPPTLQNLFNEYAKDLHLSYPAVGDLTPWCKQGVLLWNAIPTCYLGQSLSHRWDEWTYLTKEIVEVLSPQKIVFVFLGGVAREYAQFVRTPSIALELSHPIPRASLKSNKPFTGSRMFSTINAKLKELGKEPINWRLQ